MSPGFEPVLVARHAFPTDHGRWALPFSHQEITKVPADHILYMDSPGDRDLAASGMGACSVWGENLPWTPLALPPLPRFLTFKGEAGSSLITHSPGPFPVCPMAVAHSATEQRAWDILFHLSSQDQVQVTGFLSCSPTTGL